MRHRRLTYLLAATAVAAACSSRDAAPDSSQAGVPVADSSSSVPANAWFADAAPLLLAPAHSNDRALVVPADTLAPVLGDSLLQQTAALVRRDGTVTEVTLTLSTGSEGCVDGAIAPAPATGWGVGFVGTSPGSIPIDSLRGIARADSTTLAATVFRLASSIPNVQGGRFSGLPFSLVDLWRFRAPDGAHVIVATTRRQINQEDSPLEERTLIVGEADPAGEYELVYSRRSSGAEETVEGTELLAAVTFPGRFEIELVFAHDFGNETAYSILERQRRGSWHPRWTSRRFSC